MTNQEKIAICMKELNADRWEKTADWNGYAVYKPVYDDLQKHDGSPCIVLENEKEVRISTPEETLDYLNDTSKFPEEDDE